MAGKKGENTKKVAGNAKKAEAAAAKQAVADSKSAAVEDDKWNKGAKSNAKKETDVAKKADLARKKAERDALLAAEESSQPSVPKSAKAKTASRKTNSNNTPSRGTLSLDDADDEPSDASAPPAPLTTLSATGIDNALDLLTISSSTNAGPKIENHPERRFKAAYAKFEERRLPEIAEEQPGLRRGQRVEMVRRDFEKSEENPFNWAGVVGFDASKEEKGDVERRWREGVEGRLGGNEDGAKGKGKGKGKA